ncbi:MAG TPA: acyl-CoA thioesterase [Planctomycetes bacterium]|nr:acyl-CoA thioesterase [Planctomycetota bacterium]
MRAHTIRFRVRYNEVDRQDVVYHGNYLTWFDMGRTELLRDLGMPYKEMEDQGRLLVVTRASLRYLAPARLDDLLRLETRLVKITPARLSFAYDLFLEGEDLLLTQGSTELACLDREGKVRRLPPKILDLLAAPR